MRLDEVDIKILKALASMGPDENPSENNIAEKTEGRIPTPTVRRHIQPLKQAGYVAYLGRGTQNSQKYRLEKKGLFYLLLYTEKLTDEETIIITKYIINEFSTKRRIASNFSPILADRFATSASECLQEMRKKINLDFYDDEYASEVFMDTVFEHSLRFESPPESFSKKESQATFKALRRDPLLRDFLNWYFETMFEHARRNKVVWEKRFVSCQKVLRFLKENGSGDS